MFVPRDDRAAHAMGAWCSVVNRTPRGDEIATPAVQFDTCSVTNSLCAPSRCW